jgi:hypothetical protein
MWILVACGLVLWMRSLPRPLPRNVRISGAGLAGATAIGLLLVFRLATLVPSHVFNWHDDYQKYFAHPVRMLDAGSVAGGSASALGYETLGGQALLHALALSYGPPEYLNAVELGFGFVLCLALVAMHGASQSPTTVVARVLAAAAVFVINPQVVNISTTYTGSALCAALVLLCAGPREEGAAPDRSRALVCGLLLGAMCALKTTFALFAPLALATLCIALALRSDVRRALRWSLTAAFTAAIVLLPWALLHLPRYLSVLDNAPVANLITDPTAPHASLLSTAPDAYGGSSFAAYTGLVALGLVLSAARAIGAHRAGSRPPWRAYCALAMSVTLAIVYVVMVHVVAPMADGATTTLRLFTMLALGVVPAVIVLSFGGDPDTPAGARWLAAVLVLAALLPFLGPLQRRVSQAVVHGSILAFSDLALEERYEAYNFDVLHGPMRGRVRAAQASVPPGAPVIAVVNAPLWLDFARNPVEDVELAGLSVPWARVPDGRYVIWEFAGTATPQLRDFLYSRGADGVQRGVAATAGMQLTLALIELSQRARPIHDDGTIRVLQLDDPGMLRELYQGSAGRTRSLISEGRLAADGERSPD